MFQPKIEMYKPFGLTSGLQSGPVLPETAQKLSGETANKMVTFKNKTVQVFLVKPLHINQILSVVGNIWGAHSLL